MRVPVAEMQRSYALFRAYAGPLAAGAELLRDGRVSQEQFAELVRHSLVTDSAILAKRSIQTAFQHCDADRDGALKFDEFAQCMRCLMFNEAFNISSEERELRRIAKEHNLSFVEVDRYKKMFDELDGNGSGSVEEHEFEDLLYRCGSVPRELGISAGRLRSLWREAGPHADGRLGFQGFLVFHLRHFAPGSKGFGERCK